MQKRFWVVMRSHERGYVGLQAGRDLFGPFENEAVARDAKESIRESHDHMEDGVAVYVTEEGIA